MNSSLIRANQTWGMMDGFWDLVSNKQEITNVWQTLYSCVDQLDHIYQAYGALAITNMPENLTINDVIFRVVETDGATQILSAESILPLRIASSMSMVKSISKLMPTINGDTEYVEFTNYGILSASDDGITIMWATPPPEGCDTYYAPETLIENPFIDKHGNMFWDLQLKNIGLDVEKRRDVYHSLMLLSKGAVGAPTLQDVINMIAGARYSKHIGKISIGGGATPTTMSYVNRLFVVAHSGTVFGSESEVELFDAQISGNSVSWGDSNASPGDIISVDEVVTIAISVKDDGTAEIGASLIPGKYSVSFDGGLTYAAFLVNRNVLYNPSSMAKAGAEVKIRDVKAMITASTAEGGYYIDQSLPAHTYESGVKLYNVIPVILNSCYAIKGDTVYSCMVDSLPNPGPYDVVGALNYRHGQGVILAGEEIDIVPSEVTLQDDQYVYPYTSINRIHDVLYWKASGETGISIPEYNYDNYIMRNYLQCPHEWYYGGDGYSEHDLVEGDRIVATVGYSFELPVTLVDDHTIEIKSSYDEGDGIIGMYGSPVPIVVNVSIMEEMVIVGAGGERQSILVETGSYDEGTDMITIKTVSPITVLNPVKLLKQERCVHRHTVISVDPETYEIVTDRSMIYGDYADHCNVATRRAVDETLKTHIFTVKGAATTSPGVAQIDLQSDHGNIGVTAPPAEGSTTAVVWGKDIGTISLPVISVDPNENTIFVEWASGLPDPSAIAGETIMYAGGLYTRNRLYIVGHTHVFDYLSIIEHIAESLSPEGTVVDIQTGL